MITEVIDRSTSDESNKKSSSTDGVSSSSSTNNGEESEKQVSSPLIKTVWERERTNQRPPVSSVTDTENNKNSMNKDPLKSSASVDSSSTLESLSPSSRNDIAKRQKKGASQEFTGEVQTVSESGERAKPEKLRDLQEKTNSKSKTASSKTEADGRDVTTSGKNIKKATGSTGRNRRRSTSNLQKTSSRRSTDQEKRSSKTSTSETVQPQTSSLRSEITKRAVSAKRSSEKVKSKNLDEVISSRQRETVSTKPNPRKKKDETENTTIKRPRKSSERTDESTKSNEDKVKVESRQEQTQGTPRPSNRSKNVKDASTRKRPSSVTSSKVNSRKTDQQIDSIPRQESNTLQTQSIKIKPVQNSIVSENMQSRSENKKDETATSPNKVTSSNLSSKNGLKESSSTRKKETTSERKTSERNSKSQRQTTKEQTLKKSPSSTTTTERAISGGNDIDERTIPSVSSGSPFVENSKVSQEIIRERSSNVVSESSKKRSSSNNAKKEQESSMISTLSKNKVIDSQSLKASSSSPERVKENVKPKVSKNDQPSRSGKSMDTTSPKKEVEERKPRSNPGAQTKPASGPAQPVSNSNNDSSKQRPTKERTSSSSRTERKQPSPPQQNPVPLKTTQTIALSSVRTARVVPRVVMKKCQAIGDPHYTTFQGKYFDFYGVGDYILAQSTDGDFIVHSRTGRWGSVSVNTAFAVKVNNQKIIEYDIESNSFYVDGQETQIKQGDEITFGPGATAKRTAENSMTVSAQNGAHLIATWYRSSSYKSSLGSFGHISLIVEAPSTLDFNAGMCVDQSYKTQTARGLLHDHVMRTLSRSVKPILPTQEQVQAATEACKTAGLKGKNHPLALKACIEDQVQSGPKLGSTIAKVIKQIEQTADKKVKKWMAQVQTNNEKKVEVINPTVSSLQSTNGRQNAPVVAL
ncbi:hypothetical protein FDP41_005632 [Naegleria fowleri]|uniref:VWFD domain-containing protein n=1 Tax=Naegleria fowleri TaxID=5763 RepID=A0A6A5BNB3_NAEFO|nr:uncharacterized protein FDP41_005632 [Naegleria fowleri]KAF0975638.1 hypothetical protein FDP41_005632 [Naegleria fowleri]